MVQAKNRVLLLSVLFLLTTQALIPQHLLAEDGYRMWLRYDQISDQTKLHQYKNLLQYVVFESDISPAINVTKKELERGLSGLLKDQVKFNSAVDAELYYNDYSSENPEKRNGAEALIKKLQEQGIPFTGVDTQGHFSLEWPAIEQAEAAITDFAELGVVVMVTEPDIDVLPSTTDNQGADISDDEEFDESLNPWPEALPDAVQDALAQRYAELFQVYYQNLDAITRVTFWGVSDGDSWKNNWTVRVRTNYPLLFDRNWQPKPAFYTVVEIPKYN